MSNIPMGHITDIGSGISEMQYVYSKTMSRAEDIAFLFGNPLSDDYKYRANQFTLDELLLIRSSFGMANFDRIKDNTYCYIVNDKARGLCLRINFIYSDSKDDLEVKYLNVFDSETLDPYFLNPCKYDKQEVISCFCRITDEDLNKDSDRLNLLFLNLMSSLLYYNIQREYNIDFAKDRIEFDRSVLKSSWPKGIQLFTRILTMGISMLFELTQSRSIFKPLRIMDTSFFRYYIFGDFDNEFLSELSNKILDISCQNGFLDEKDPSYDKICFLVQDHIKDFLLKENWL